MKRTDNDDRFDRYYNHTQQFVDTTERIGKVILGSRSGQDVLEVIAAGLLNSFEYVEEFELDWGSEEPAGDFYQEDRAFDFFKYNWQGFNKLYGISASFLSYCDYQTKLIDVIHELLRRESRKPRKRSKNEKNQKF